MLEMINTTGGALTAAQNIPFSQVTFDTNNNVSGNPSTGVASITVPGIYKITGTFVLEATSTGNVTVNMYADGTEVEGATAQFSAAAANTIETIVVEKMIQVESAAAGNTAQVSFQLGQKSADTSLINAVMQVQFID